MKPFAQEVSTLRLNVVVADAVILLALTAVAQPARAQSDPASIDLVVGVGRPLRVALDARIPLKRAGQPVTGVVIEPVYAYDRVVIPVGAKVRGHVAQIDGG